MGDLGYRDAQGRIWFCGRKSHRVTTAEGKTFQPGPTDHDSNIIQVRPGLLEDQLSAPLVTADGGTYGGVPSVKHDDKSLWGNNLN